jgi:hypothetical protein
MGVLALLVALRVRQNPAPVVVQSPPLLRTT